MEKKNNIKIKANNLIGRGEFLKRLGGGAAVTAAALAGCDKSAVSTSETLGEVPTDKMTYRVNKEKGDRVSILGYGCMRWPTRKRDDGEGESGDAEHEGSNPRVLLDCASLREGDIGRET